MCAARALFVTARALFVAAPVPRYRRYGGTHTATCSVAVANSTAAAADAAL